MGKTNLIVKIIFKKKEVFTEPLCIIILTLLEFNVNKFFKTFYKVYLKLF